MPPISGPIAGCGVARPYHVSAVAGVALTPAAIMDCNTAVVLKDWTQQAVIPLFGSYHNGVQAYQIVGHYACRTRYGRDGAKLSEHAKGRAIDIAAFRMKDGRDVSVLRDWGQGTAGRILQKLHKKACGPFGTVLGPAANDAHKDHFHFDTAPRNHGAYCR
ncbi:MAG: extensin family protein [Pseudomonadota bacterium]